NILFNPFNTSYGNENNILTSLPLPGVTLDMAYDFLKESGTKFRQVGAGYTINGIPLPFVYSSHDIIYNFPMGYLNVDSCDYKFGLPIPSIGFYGQSGHRVNVVDGWGTLITPYGTFNTLRVKSTIAAIDTVALDAFGFGTNITRPTRYEYKWLATAEQIPVLKVDAADVGGAMVVNNVEYIDSIIPGVPQLGLSENDMGQFNSNIYPNPFVNNMTVQFELTSKLHLTMSVMDVFGKEIAVILNETKTAGNYQQKVDITELGLASGVYLFVIQSDTAREIHKIVVSK
nr:T9SS type A sorting domain-containing protein [Bacteroidota bacterium]